MISLRDVSFAPDGVPVLEDIDLEIQAGQLVAVLGPNGAGKSMLLKVILDLVGGYAGEVTIDGRRNTQWLKDNPVGYLPQKETFDKQFPASGLDIVLLGLAGTRGLFRHFTRADRDAARAALELVDAGHLGGRLIGRLSGGELQRVLIARALVTGSRLLLLDEPEAGIDAEQTERFYELLRRLRDEGKTIVLVSHDVAVMSRYADSIVCLNRRLHCHTAADLLSAEIIRKTYGDVLRLIEKDHGAHHA